MSSENTAPVAQAPTDLGTVAKKTRVFKSPMLTELERVVYDRCIETGNKPGESMQFDPVVASRILEFVSDQIRVERIEEKLENNIGWVKQQLAKLKAGVREMSDEPVGVCEAVEGPTYRYVNVKFPDADKPVEIAVSENVTNALDSLINDGSVAVVDDPDTNWINQELAESAAADAASEMRDAPEGDA